MPSVKIPNGAGGWIKIPTVKGDAGTITSVTLTSGNHAAGTTDTYTITYNDNSTTTFTVYNGADGNGAGDMLASVYDPTAKNADAFARANHTGTQLKSTISDFPTSMTPTAHKTSHATGGADVLAASDIGASASTHTHGNITNDGKIGSTADLPVFTTTAGAVTTKTIADAKTLLGIVAGAQIATGSYAGTDTYGSSNPISITASFEIKELSIIAKSTTPRVYQETTKCLPPLNINVFQSDVYVRCDLGTLGSSTIIQTTWFKKSVDGKTIYIYDTVSATNQWNSSAYTYYYIVKG